MTPEEDVNEDAGDGLRELRTIFDADECPGNKDSNPADQGKG